MLRHFDHQSGLLEHWQLLWNSGSVKSSWTRSTRDLRDAQGREDRRHTKGLKSVMSTMLQAVTTPQKWPEWCKQVITDTGGMSAPDARAAFLDAVLCSAELGAGIESAPGDSHGSGYSHEQMMDPAQYMPLLARAFPRYVNSLKVSNAQVR